MNDELNNNSLKDLFNTTNSFLVILPPEPDQNLLSAAVSLHLSLRFSGKQSQIGCSTPLAESGILGQSEVVETIGNKNLHISFDFLETDLNKVDYEVDSYGKFSIIINPKDGANPPDSSKVKFNYSGAAADLAIVFAVSSLEELGPIYAQEKKYLDDTKILAINNSPVPIQFTNNIYQGTPRSDYSEVVTTLLQRVGLKPSPEASTNLIKSTYLSTKNLTTANTTAETFANISFLMKNGGHLPTGPTAPPDHAFARPTDFAPSFPGTAPSVIPTDWQIPKIFKGGQS